MDAIASSAPMLPPSMAPGFATLILDTMDGLLTAGRSSGSNEPSLFDRLIVAGDGSFALPSLRVCAHCFERDQSLRSRAMMTVRALRGLRAPNQYISSMRDIMGLDR